jgi:hypothetical protein
MPQYLKIEVEGTIIGLFSTGNKGGTIYDISLQVPEIGTDYSIPDVDTGVQRQPQDPQERRKDFQNDLIHARRCIAGIVSSAEKLLVLLQADSKQITSDIKPITMNLMTNSYDRGIIEAQPIEDQLTDVIVTFGMGANRFQNAIPTDKLELEFKAIKTSRTGTHIERAFYILSSIGPTLLQYIGKQISH